MGSQGQGQQRTVYEPNNKPTTDRTLTTPLATTPGNLQEAISEWTACLEVDPSNRPFNAKLYGNRGTAYSKLRRHQEAVDDCTRAIDLDPMYLKAYNRRAESLRCLEGEPNEMKAHLQAALRDYEKVRVGGWVSGRERGGGKGVAGCGLRVAGCEGRGSRDES